MAARPSEALQGTTVGISSAEEIDVSALDATLTRFTRGVYVGVTGDLDVQFVGDSAQVTLAGLAAGVWHPMQVQKVFATSTASGIVVGY